MSNTRKSRSRSISEPPEMPSSIRRKSSIDEGMGIAEDHELEGQSQTWAGSLRSFVWSLWNQGSSGSVGAAGSDEGSGMSDSEANLSEYEEQIRRNRELPDPHAGSSSAVPIVSSRLRKNSSATTPIVSPRHEPSPFLDQGDYGICLEDDESHDSKDYLMTTDLISKLHAGLPSRWRIASAWTLLYSTNFHGFSLSTMLKRSKDFKGPAIVAIKDTEGNLFGAFVTEPFHQRIGHFGTGECFLWKLEQPSGRVRRYKSTGNNDYFMMCESGYIAVGCGEGKFGLWIDSQFENGHSHAVPTFNNEPLSSGENFVCVTFELWGLLCEEV